MEIYFTKHAKEKFSVLARHGVKISHEKVIKTVTSPERVDHMKKSNITITYDPEADVLSWEIARKAKIDYAYELGNIVVHFTKNHIPALLEMLEASKLLKQSQRAIRKARELAPAH